ncbi:MAG: endolytic transglycosylase MltG [Myxococcales bacterium]|nr:endolytic transglycosylase MltG [Myxococcales bacterium]
MGRAILWIVALVILGGIGFAAWRLADERNFAATPFGEGARTVVVPAGSGPHVLAKLLADARVVSDERRFYTHLHWFRRGKQAKAGEYEFDGPLLPDEVLGKLIRGEVKLYKFTIPEGLRVDEASAIIGQTGLCSRQEFLATARDPASPKRFGVPGPSLEGYLFPDTYSLPRSVGCAGIVQTMVARFQRAWQNAQKQRLPEIKLDEQQAVTLASIVEKETGQSHERAHVSCVFHNRMKRHMPLQTDPTVIYALLLSNDFKWDGNIHKSDLSLQHPYNTYVIKGLPPGPIANPGAAALDAALHPMACRDLYFVSRNDGTTVFCPDLKCHNANVQKFQVQYFRHKHG